MRPEELVAFFRARENAANNWQDILASFKRLDPNDGNFYMLSVNKGTPDETRSRFLTYNEALAVIMEQIRKSDAK